MNEKQPLDGILDQDSATPPDPEALKRIVGRRDRITRIWTIAVAVLAVILGSLGGVAAFSLAAAVEESDPVVTAEAIAPQAERLGPASDIYGGPVSIDMPKWNRLFNRDADGVAVRGFEVPIVATADLPKAESPESCAPSDFKSVVAQVSNENMVGVVYGGTERKLAGREAVVAGAEVVGIQEGAPLAVVIVHTGSEVSSVRYKTAAGSDQMTVMNGWAILVAATPETTIDGTIEGLDNNGAVVTNVTLPLPQPELEPKAIDGSAPTAGNSSSGCAAGDGTEPRAVPLPMPTDGQTTTQSKPTLPSPTIEKQ